MKKPEGELKLWDLAAGKERMTFVAHGNAVVFSPDGRLLAFRDDKGAVQIVDLSTLKPARGTGDASSLSCVSFAPDGKTLATGDADGVVKLWDVETATVRIALRTHGGKEVRALAFSPDGKTVATAGMDKTIILLQAATGLELLYFKNLPEYAHALAFSPDGTILAAALHDGTVRLYLGDRKR
jgi:hypothetical protein